MAYAPCKNPNCKSYGRPHPNCQCYGGMAEGGPVKSYCEMASPHMEGCEYRLPERAPVDHAHAVAGHFADGGILGTLHLHKNPKLSSYELSARRGHKKLHEHFETIFSGGKIPREDRKEQREAVDRWVAPGGVLHNMQKELHKNDPLHLADGGMAAHEVGLHHGHPVAEVYPEQNIMLQKTKGLVSNHLGELRPQENLPKLAFDKAPDQSLRKKNYQKALKIADHPLSILREISAGTLTQDSLGHLSAMYPELAEAMKKKATEKIISSQLSGKNPGHRVRQSLSLLMGVPLSAEYSPQNISAAQATFSVQPQAQPAPEQKAKKSSAANLSKSDEAYLTGSQALSRRSQRTN